MTALSPTVLLVLALALPACSAPRLKWVSAASSLYLERWGGAGTEGNGFAWRSRSVLYNPPQTLAYLHFGAGVDVHPRVNVSLAFPLFRSSIDAYTSSRSGVSVPGQSALGMGDIELAASARAGFLSLRSFVAFPWAYEAEFLKPWKGAGVYRAGLGASWTRGPNTLRAAGETAVYQPEGALVEPWDFSIKGEYVFKRPVARRFAFRAGGEASFSSMSWAGDEPQHNYSLDPRAGLSFMPAPGHEVSASGSATLYSYQGGSRTYHTYASRRVSFGLAYGRYF
jgi:hypothetical protein